VQEYQVLVLMSVMLSLTQSYNEIVVYMHGSWLIPLI